MDRVSRIFLGLVLVAIVGAVVGVVVGFFADAAAAGSQFVWFSQWLVIAPMGGLPHSFAWGLSGAATAVAAGVAAILLQPPTQRTADRP